MQRTDLSVDSAHLDKQPQKKRRVDDSLSRSRKLRNESSGAAAIDDSAASPDGSLWLYPVIFGF